MCNKILRILPISAFLASVILFMTVPWDLFAESAIPKVRQSVRPLDLSRTPSTEELMAAGQLGGQLHPTHEEADVVKRERVNLSFGQAIQEWNKHNYKDAVKMFKIHVKDYPDSPWASESVLHVGCDATYNGRYSEAEENFNWILENNKDKDHEGANILINKAKMRLGILRVYQNNFQEAKQLFGELKKESSNWRDRTYASHWIQRLSRYSSNQLAMLNCGTQALAHILEKDGKKDEARKAHEMLPETVKGHSIKDLSNIATQYGYNLTALKISSADLNKLPLPAIMHINGQEPGGSGHYWILEKIDGDNLKLHDPQSRGRFSQDIEEFSREWSGNALVFSNSESLPGARLSENEMEQIYGGCCGVPRPEDNLGTPGVNAGGPPNNECPEGAPVWSVNMVNMNLFMTDTPMWYAPTIGPPVRIQLSYNSQSSIAQYEPFGNKWTFNYGSYLVVDTGGNVTVFMPDGRRDVYTPDGQNGYTRPFGIFNTLTQIGPNHFELAFLDGNIYVYKIPQNTNSLQPFLVEIRDAYNQKLTFGYNSSVHLTTVADALGKITNIIDSNSDGLIDRIDDPFGRSAYFEYDAAGNLFKITDMGGYWTEFGYDGTVYLTKIENERGTRDFYIEPADGIFVNGYPLPGGVMWESYRITITNPSGGREEFFYTGSGERWYVSPRDYMPFVDSNINNTIAAKTTYFPDNILTERIGSIRYPEGEYLYFNYDIDTGNVAVIMDNDGHRKEYTYNANGLITSFKDAKGNIFTIEYYQDNIDIERIRFNLSSTSEDDNIILKTFTYNGDTHDIDTVSDRLNIVTEFAYNSFGQLNAITEAKGIAIQRLTEMVYDPVKHELNEIKKNGNAVSSFTYDNISRVRTYTDDRGITLTYDYNNLDQITETTYPDNKFETVTYSSCCPRIIDSITDRAGLMTNYKYDALKRLIEVQLPYGIIKYGYDANGNRIKMMDVDGKETLFEYDLDDRLKKKIYPDSKFVTYEYSSELLRVYTNSRNITKTYFYDVNHNITKIDYSDITPDVVFTYDDYNRLDTMTDGIGLHDYGYDDIDRLTSVDGPLTDDTITYQYNELDQLKTFTLQGGQAISYFYDYNAGSADADVGRLKEIKIGTNTFTYSYTGVNPLIQSLTRPNGSITEYVYNDPLKRLTEIANKSSESAIINKHSFTFNNLDLIDTEIITTGTALDSFAAGLKTYNYNNLNQLLNSTNPAEIFTYDDDGNMTQGYTPDGYQFTATYDAENRLKTIQYIDNSSVAHNTEYFYGGTGLLAEVKEFEDGELVNDTRYVRDGFLPVQEQDANNNISREYTWGLNLGGGIGGLLNLKQGASDYSYLYDGKGNVSALMDSLQNIVASYRYDVFGKPLKKTATLDQPYRFSTKQYDEKIGHYHFGFRFYNPVIGKWMTRDPIGEQSDINLYRMVGNNPANWIDPLGLFYFGKRPLSEGKAPWLPIASSNPIDDYFNTALSHEHGFFEDGSGENIGFGPKGRFSEDPTGKGYRYDDKHYDDDLMRNALKNIKDGDYSNLPWKKNNCQDWADRLRQEYERLKRGQ